MKYMLGKLYKQRGKQGKQFKHHYRNTIREHILSYKNIKRIRVKPILQEIKRLNKGKLGNPREIIFI